MARLSTYAQTSDVATQFRRLAGLMSYNVRNYGALGDGSTNDSSAFNSAFSDAAADGRPAYIPAGTYFIDSNLSWPSNLTVVGDGRTSVVKLGNSISTLGNVSSKSNIYVYDVAFQGRRDVAVGANLLSFALCDSIQFFRCYFLDHLNSACTIGPHTGNSGFDGCEWDNCGYFIDTNTNAPCALIYGSTGGASDDESRAINVHNFYRNCRVLPTATAFTMSLQRYFSIVGNDCVAYASTGCYVSRCHDGVIADNRFSGPGTGIGDVGKGGQGLDTASIERVTIANNICYESGAAGILVAGSSRDITIVGNICFNNFLSYTSGTPSVHRGGITLDDDPVNITIVGNKCTDTQTVKTQAYGLDCRVLITFDNIWVDSSNDFTGNKLGEIGTNVSYTSDFPIDYSGSRKPIAPSFVPASGVALKGAFNTETATLTEVARRVKAIEDAVRSFGIIGDTAYPLANATLDMDFYGNQYTGKTDSDLTFTRATVGTDLFYHETTRTSYTTFSSGVKRLAAGTGLIVEAARTQYLGVTDAPATQTTSSLNTGTYTLWVIGSGSAAVSAGTATLSGAGTATAGSYNTFTVTSSGTVIVTVTGSLTFFQLENGAEPSSYIPNAGAAGTTLTRNADICSLQSTAFSDIWGSPTAVTVFVDFESKASTAFGTNQSIVSISDNSASNRLSVFRAATTGLVGWRCSVGGVASVSTSSSGSVSQQSRSKVAFTATAATDGFLGTLNGNTFIVGTPTSLPSVNRIYLGSSETGGATWLNGIIRRVAIVPASVSAEYLHRMADA